ncbi:MAG: TonB-dependent receptor plug domain-containing protein [Sulfurovaceae bacterium]
MGNKPRNISIILLLLTAMLPAQDITLGNIEIISTNKTKQKATKTTADIDVITSEDIRQNGYTSIVDALSNSLGINISQNGGVGQKSSFFLRGMDSGKILVLVDGMRLNDPSTTNNTSLIEFLPISNVEQIEIIRGGSSSVWGANASAGVINIITKKALKDGLSGSIGVEGGSHGTKGSDLSLFYKNGKLNAKLLGSYLDTNGISVPIKI